MSSPEKFPDLSSSAAIFLLNHGVLLFPGDNSGDYSEKGKPKSSKSSPGLTSSILMSSPPAAQDLLPGQDWPPSPSWWLPPPFKSQESKIIFEWSPKVLNISNLLINPPVFRSIFSHLLFRELPLALQPGCLDVILDRRQTHLRGGGGCVGQSTHGVSFMSNINHLEFHNIVIIWNSSPVP